MLVLLCVEETDGPMPSCLKVNMLYDVHQYCTYMYKEHRTFFVWNIQWNAENFVVALLVFTWCGLLFKSLKL